MSEYSVCLNKATENLHRASKCGIILAPFLLLAAFELLSFYKVAHNKEKNRSQVRGRDSVAAGHFPLPSDRLHLFQNNSVWESSVGALLLDPTGFQPPGHLPRYKLH